MVFLTPPRLGVNAAATEFPAHVRLPVILYHCKNPIYLNRKTEIQDNGEDQLTRA